jgi:hypothetical protein
LEAFLHHYRSLGIAHFVFLDDHSTDQTLQILHNQDDVTILSSELQFSSPLVITVGKNENLFRLPRASDALKAAIPSLINKTEEEAWILYVDADEFLILEADETIDSLIIKANGMGIEAFSAAQLEMYPETFCLQSTGDRPKNISEILATSPFFDDRTLIKVMSQTGKLLTAGRSASARLFSNMRPESGSNLKLTSSTFKTPLYKASVDRMLYNSHWVTCATTPTRVLVLLHFKFAGNWVNKVNSAVIEKRHAAKSAKYRAYELLIASMRNGDVKFKDCSSRRYRLISDLENIIKYE